MANIEGLLRDLGTVVVYHRVADSPVLRSLRELLPEEELQSPTETYTGFVKELFRITCSMHWRKTKTAM